MSAALDEARMLQRIALRDQRAFAALVVACSPDDVALPLITPEQAESIVNAVLARSATILEQAT